MENKCLRKAVSLLNVSHSNTSYFYVEETGYLLSFLSKCFQDGNNVTKISTINGTDLQ